MTAIASILIVEDEMIVAQDLQSRLTQMGYDVPDLAASGSQAIEIAQKSSPDLMLVDIRLKGRMDGVETVRRIKALRDTPVVYLTAHSDPDTLDRAKSTEPYGYLIKPFNAEELKTTIEMALHKHAMETERRDREKWLLTTLDTIGDGLIVTDLNGSIELMNPVAEAATGWTQASAKARPMVDILHIVDEETGEAMPDPALRAIREAQAVQITNPTVLIGKDGSRLPVAVGAAPFTDSGDSVAGAVLTFHDMSCFRRIEDNLRAARDQLARQVGERTKALAQSDRQLHQATTERIHAEEAIRRAEEQLQVEQRAVTDKAIALREVMGQMDYEKAQLASYFQSNVDRIVMPLLRRLESKVGPTARTYLSQLDTSLANIMSPFVNHLESAFSSLSPREVQICSMIKDGLTSKEIAATFDVSVETVRHQRKDVRRKLGIGGDKANLRSFLETV
jgi:PAS domain S-box-containing protein